MSTDPARFDSAEVSAILCNIEHARSKGIGEKSLLSGEALLRFAECLISEHALRLVAEKHFKLACLDSVSTDDVITDMCKLFTGELYGDSYGVPHSAEYVEALVLKLQAAEARAEAAEKYIAECESVMDSDQLKRAQAAMAK